MGYLILVALLVLIAFFYFRRSHSRRTSRQSSAADTETSRAQTSREQMTTHNAEPSREQPTRVVRTLVKSPWFNPNSPYDQKVTTYLEPQNPVEVDTPNALRFVQSEEFYPRNQFVVYQQWGEEIPDVGRPLYWFDLKAATTVAEIIKGGPTRKLILICTTFQPGSIRRFAEEMVQDQSKNNGNQLEFLGFFWYFSGDDITDDSDYAAEIAFATNCLSLKRLSILTGAFNNECEDRLFEGLQQNTSLQHFGVFYKSEEYTWQQIPTPKIDELVNNNRRE